MRLLLFAGAGTSVELGVPAMGRMATEFLEHAEEWGTEPEMARRLMPEGTDIEDLIEALDQLCGAGAPIRALGLAEDGLEAASVLQAEVEWFVQHQCERVMPHEALLQWGSVISSVSDHELVVATTNYDRAVEFAANRLGMAIKDGFEPFTGREITPWAGWDQNDGYAGPGTITLLKLHGSTDWYEASGTGAPVKLRHPMALFAGGSLRLPRAEVDLTAALILPSREKRVTRAPYPRLSQVFLNAADCADLAVFVGTSLRDPHIRQALDSVATRMTTFIVGRSRSVPLPTSVQHIKQTASEFLISTLPTAMQHDDPTTFLSSHASRTPDDCVGILPYVATALDDAKPANERCSSIERLEELDCSLDKHIVESLLRDDTPVVRRFALGLVPASVDSSYLLGIAKRLAIEGADDTFQSECKILEELVD